MSWVQLVQAVSAEFATRLAAAALPALVDGAILLGPQHLAASSSPPRVVFVPMGSKLSVVRSVAGRQTMAANNASAEGAGVAYVSVTNPGSGSGSPTVAFSAPDLAGGTVATGAVVQGSGGSATAVRLTSAGSGYLAAPTVTISGAGVATATAFLGRTAEYYAELKQRAIGTDSKAFTVWVWGCTYSGSTPAPSPDGDWDAAELLYQTLIQSIHALMPGSYTLGKGKWIDSTRDGAKLISLGRLYTFELEIATPLPDAALTFAPVGTYGEFTLQTNTAGPGDPITITG